MCAPAEWRRRVGTELVVLYRGSIHENVLRCIILYLSSFPSSREGFTELYHSVFFIFFSSWKGLLACIILYPSSFFRREIYKPLSFCILLHIPIRRRLCHPERDILGCIILCSLLSHIRKEIYRAVSFCILLLLPHQERKILDCIILYPHSFLLVKREIHWAVSFCIPQSFPLIKRKIYQAVPFCVPHSFPLIKIEK